MDSVDQQSNDDNLITCHVCGHGNLKGTLICDKCGATLKPAQKRTGTRNLREELPEFQTNPVFTSQDSSGDFLEAMRLKLDIVGQDARMEIVPQGRTLVIGRRDPVSGRKPEIDMEDYEGYRLGVSRKHAGFALQGKELTLQDYGSANGTYLNGVRLPSHEAHKVHDGDVIRFGHLTVRAYFISE